MESHRNRCLVVGEDLGTVPPGFREHMSEARILSYRVLFFEQDGADGKLIAAERYPKLAVAVAGSHDLPTLRGWLQAGDIKLKESLKLYSTKDEFASQLAMRDRERSVVLAALELEPATVEQRAFSDAVHSFLARTKCVLVMAQLDDLLDEHQPVNVPATSTEHPNWRRRYNVAVEALDTEHPAWRPINAIKRQRT